MSKHACEWSLRVLALTAASLLLAAPTRAQDTEGSAAAPAKPISAALLLGAGFAFEDVNPYGFGFGLRGGYNIQQIYLGIRFNYYLGETYDADTGQGAAAETSANVWELGIEGGYDLLVADKLTIRPQLGLGIANYSVEVDSPLFGASLSGSDANFYLALGATGLYDITPDIFVGFEPRFQFVFGGDSLTALTLMATVGMRFGT